jgi:hypothetical protein
MKRPQDWPSRLAIFLREKSTVPFSWGRNDCCLFTCDWLAALFGVDHAAALRGTYDTALSAARVLEERGGVLAIAGAVCEREGWSEVHPAFARRGDIVADLSPLGHTLGVCAGGLSAFPGESGVMLKPTRECVRAWRVG